MDIRNYFKPDIHYNSMRNQKPNAPEEVKDKDKEWVLINLQDEIHSFTGIYVNLDPNIEDNDDTLKNEVDRLTGLLNKVKMREMETIREQILSYMNGYLCANNFSFMIENEPGRIHFFDCDVRSLTGFTNTVMCFVWQYPNDPIQILYEDDDGEKIVIASDSDLTEAVNYARSVGRKYLKLHLDMDG